MRTSTQIRETLSRKQAQLSELRRLFGQCTEAAQEAMDERIERLEKEIDQLHRALKEARASEALT